jgi:hypothetical protein
VSDILTCSREVANPSPLAVLAYWFIILVRGPHLFLTMAIDGHKARGPSARPTTCYFGLAQAWQGTTTIEPVPSRPNSRAMPRPLPWPDMLWPGPAQSALPVYKYMKTLIYSSLSLSPHICSAIPDSAVRSHTFLFPYATLISLLPSAAHPAATCSFPLVAARRSPLQL